MFVIEQRNCSETDTILATEPSEPFGIFFAFMFATIYLVNMKKIIILSVSMLLSGGSFALGETISNERMLTLNEAIALARVQSVDAAVALNELKTAYWEYRTFRADLLPEVNLTGTLPNYNKSYNSYQNSDGSYSFVRNNTLGLLGALSVV